MSEAVNSLAVRVQSAWFAARDEESGQTLVEYALIIALVSLAAIVALGFLSDQINDLFSRAGNSINSTPAPPVK